MGEREKGREGGREERRVESHGPVLWNVPPLDPEAKQLSPLVRTRNAA